MIIIKEKSTKVPSCTYHHHIQKVLLLWRKQNIDQLECRAPFFFFVLPQNPCFAYSTLSFLSVSFTFFPCILRAVKGRSEMGSVKVGMSRHAVVVVVVTQRIDMAYSVRNMRPKMMVLWTGCHPYFIPEMIQKEIFAGWMNAFKMVGCPRVSTLLHGMMLCCAELILYELSMRVFLVIHRRQQRRNQI